MVEQGKGVLSFTQTGKFRITLSTGEDLSQRKVKPPYGAIIGSILGIIAWLVFILLYALVWSKGYSLFENIIVTIVSFLIIGLAIALMWMVWGFRTGWRRMNWGDW